MPQLVQSIVIRHLKDLSDRDLKVIADDERFQEDLSLWGDTCDKVDWKNFYQILREWQAEGERVMRNDHKQWLKERDEAAYSFDVDKFKKFYEKWQKRGVYNMPLPSDEVIEISMRKMVCSMANPDEDKLAEARAWLSERGYSWSIYTD